MSEIKWKEGAVCYADGEQWFCGGDDRYELINKSTLCICYSFPDMVDLSKNLQLNEPQEGYYITKSELDTEEKFNIAMDALKLFGLKGFHFSDWPLQDAKAFLGLDNHNWREDLRSDGGDVKVTFEQLMAIGSLKREMIKREKSAPKTAPDLTPDISDNVKSPSHYQLIEGIESIEIIARSMTKEQWHGFCLGNILKYRIRAGKKDKLQQDIDKANFYGELYEMHKDKCYK
tara:strand:+ start:28 stop:720 length:693 start_codon:yes stop_codon:yes gene_type:complete